MLEVQGERQTRLIRQTDTGQVQKVGWLCSNNFTPAYLISKTISMSQDLLNQIVSVFLSLLPLA
jgi:hypothetical protein